MSNIKEKMFGLSLFSKVSLLAFVLFFCVALETQAASLKTTPATGVYTAGATFTARVTVNTAGDAINAAEGSIGFDPSQLSVVSVRKGDIFSLWTVEPTYSNSKGTITFGGGSPSGYKGSVGTVLAVTFRTKVAGTAKVSFKSGSVLAADGLGTNVLTDMAGGSYTIVAADVSPEPEVIEYVAAANTPSTPVITSSTHTSSDGWYTNTSAELSWTVPSDIVAVRTLLDGNSGSVPTKVYDSPISIITIDDLDEGVQYFHLQFKNAEGWGRVAHYRLAVDSAAPYGFSIDATDGHDFSNPVQTFALTIKDEGSGISHYAVKVDNGDSYKAEVTASSTVTLEALTPGEHSVIIEAFDFAGNSTIATRSFSVLAFDKPQFTDFPSEVPANIIPVIKGITKPNSAVTVLISLVGTEPVEYKMESDADGIFTFIPSSKLVEGVYELQAVALDQYGAMSEMSDVVKIAVQQPGMIRIGSLIVTVLSVVVPLIGLALLLFLGVLFFIIRIRKLRKVVGKETKEALAILEKEFKVITKTMLGEQKKLEKSRKTKKLTKAEANLITTMTETLDKSYKDIKKEITDVDDIVE